MTIDYWTIQRLTGDNGSSAIMEEFEHTFHDKGEAGLGHDYTETEDGFTIQALASDYKDVMKKLREISAKYEYEVLYIHSYHSTAYGGIYWDAIARGGVIVFIETVCNVLYDDDEKDSIAYRPFIWED